MNSLRQNFRTHSIFSNCKNSFLVLYFSPQFEGELKRQSGHFRPGLAIGSTERFLIRASSLPLDK